MKMSLNRGDSAGTGARHPPSNHHLGKSVNDSLFLLITRCYSMHMLCVSFDCLLSFFSSVRMNKCAVGGGVFNCGDVAQSKKCKREATQYKCGWGHFVSAVTRHNRI